MPHRHTTQHDTFKSKKMKTDTDKRHNYEVIRITDTESKLPGKVENKASAQSTSVYTT